MDLYIAARENGDTEALQASHEIRQEIKAINKEIRELHKGLAGERKSFKEAVKAGDINSASEHINNWISIKSSINSKIKDKLLLLDRIIAILA